MGRGKEPTEHHLVRFFVARQRHLGPAGNLGDRVANPDVGQRFEIGDHVTDLSDPQLIAGHLARPEPSQTGDFVVGAAGHEPDLLADLQHAIDHANVSDHTLVIIEFGIENQGSQRLGGIAGRGRDPVDDLSKDLRHPHAPSWR